jgi:hypothetical protein
MLSQEHIDGLKKAYGGPMTAPEVQILRDMQGFIEFSIRNGLGFGLVVSTLGHDVNNIAKCGFDVDQVKSNLGFTPKVEGFSEALPESVGEPDADSGT